MKSITILKFIKSHLVSDCELVARRVLDDEDLLKIIPEKEKLARSLIYRRLELHRRIIEIFRNEILNINKELKDRENEPSDKDETQEEY